MHKITIKGHFSAAHFLEDYEGLCGSVHGHRWEVVLSLKANPCLETQMIVDFSDLKRTLNEILNEMDHSFILDPEGNEQSRAFYALATKYGMRVFRFTGRTTAENIATFIYKEIQRRIGWSTHSVEVFEAPGNSVIYSES